MNRPAQSRVRSRTLFASAFLCLAGGAFAATAHAQTTTNIPVPNFDFSATGTQNAVVTNQSSGTAVPGFNVSADGYYGVQVNNGDPNLPGNATAAFINGQTSNGATTFTTEGLGANGAGVTIAANSTYQLTLDVGYNPANGGGFNVPADSATLGFTAGGTLLGQTVIPQSTILADTAANGTNYATYTFSFTTDANSAAIGQDLEVQFGANLTSSASQTYFDNVQVNVTSVPEPSTWAMMLGFLALLFGGRYVRRMVVA